jgi:hypothetical protein
MARSEGRDSRLLRMGNSSRTEKSFYVQVLALRIIIVAALMFYNSQLFLLVYQFWYMQHDINISSVDKRKLTFEHQQTSFLSVAGEPRKLPRVLAIVFPQYHSDALNDNLWGEGFTDWDNLRLSPEKNRLGFEIPRPTELGYYNLRNSTTRKTLGELASAYGIDGFVFHHYWFYDPSHPGPNLHAPLMDMLEDGYPNIDFCLHCRYTIPKYWRECTLSDLTIIFLHFIVMQGVIAVGPTHGSEKLSIGKALEMATTSFKNSSFPMIQTLPL